MADLRLRIGELARRTGVSARAIRSMRRRESCHRQHEAPTATAYAVEMLRFVKHAQGLGLTLAEIKEIVAIRRGGRRPCRHVCRLLQEEAAELDRKLNDLVMLRRRIPQSQAVRGRQWRGQAAVCPHTESPVETVRCRRPTGG